MRLLITGSNGFVAGSVIMQAQQTWEVHGIARNIQTSPVSKVHYHAADLTRLEELKRLFATIQPHVVIHAAAIANIDYCQEHQQLAKAMNVEVTNVLVSLSKEANAKLIFCSTDSVFDGIKGNYTEDDVASPVNFYAATKLEAEHKVLSSSPGNIVARLSLVMGLPVLGKGNSFMADTIAKLIAGEQVRFPMNETRTPLDVITAGKALVEMALTDFGGILHLAGETSINRYAMAKQIATAAGFSQDLIAPIDSNAIPGRAPRPNNASLDNSKVKQLLRTPMLTLAEGLALTLKSRKEL